MKDARNHKDAIAAMDFFIVPTASLRMLYVLFVIDHATRAVEIAESIPGGYPLVFGHNGIRRGKRAGRAGNILRR